MNTSQRVIKNTMWLYLRMGASILVNIFTTRILLQALGASDYGLYNVVGGAITMLGFLTASMSTSTQRFISYTLGEGDKEKLKSIFNNTLCLHYAIAGLSALLLIAASFVWFNGVLNIPDGRETVAMFVYVCLVFSTIYSITIVPYDGVLNAHENMRFYSLIGIFDVFVKLGIAVAVYFATYDQLVMYATLMALEAWILRVVTKYYCSRYYKECKRQELRKYFNRSTIKELTSFAGWNMLNITTLMFSVFGINLVVNHYFGTTLNAALGIATQLSGVLMGISMNMIKAVTPVLVKSEGGHQRENVLKITFVGCKFSFLLFSFFCIPMMFYISQVLELWLKDVPEWTATFCILIMTSTLVDQMTVFLYQSLQAQGDIKEYSIVKGIINILPILSSIIMFSLFGFEPYWALINLIIGKGILGGIINLYYCSKNISLSLGGFASKVIVRCVNVTLYSVLLGFVLYSLSIHWLLGISLFFISSIPCYWLWGMNREERKMTMNFIKRKSNHEHNNTYFRKP
jgi:hypothetical protein